VKITAKDLGLTEEEMIPDKKDKKKKKSSHIKEKIPQKVDIEAGFDVPEGALSVASYQTNEINAKSLADIDISSPLQDNERLPELTHYSQAAKKLAATPTAPQPEIKENEKKKTKHHHKEGKEKDKEKRHHRHKKRRTFS